MIFLNIYKVNIYQYVFMSTDIHPYLHIASKNKDFAQDVCSPMICFTRFNVAFYSILFCTFIALNLSQDSF